jgi:hypothetical protein
MDDTEYQNIMEKCKKHLKSLELITKSTKELPEGGCYYDHKSYNINPAYIPKQKNIMCLVSGMTGCQSKTTPSEESPNASEGSAKLPKHILEIGFNMGHSCLFILMVNPECKIHCIDICEHAYTKYCFEYLNNVFPNRITLYQGNSHEGLSVYNPKDDEKPTLCHIDGCHETNVANIDYFLCKSKCAPEAVIIFDDTWFPNLNSLWEGYVKDGHLEEFVIHPTPEKGHRYGRLKIQKKWESITDKNIDKSDKTQDDFSLQNKRICVCTLTLGEKYKEAVEQATITKTEYCKRYGYSFRCDEDVHDTTRPPAWSKIKLLQKCLREKEFRNEDGETNAYVNTYDYVVWMDADTLIMNPDKRLDDFIKLYGGDKENPKDIILAQDWTRLNTGVMFIKNTPWVLDFLDLVYSKTEYIHDPDWDQKSFIVCYENNLLHSQDHIKVLSIYQQREINSYYCMYKFGDFIIHIAGCFRDGVDKGLKEMVERVCPHYMKHDSNDTYNQRMYWLRNSLNQ